MREKFAEEETKQLKATIREKDKEIRKVPNWRVALTLTLTLTRTRTLTQTLIKSICVSQWKSHPSHATNFVMLTHSESLNNNNWSPKVKEELTFSESKLEPLEKDVKAAKKAAKAAHDKVSTSEAGQAAAQTALKEAEERLKAMEEAQKKKKEGIRPRQSRT